MSISTLTSKGQVTIPKNIRERLGLRTGDRLGFCVEQDGTIRVHPITRKVAEVFGLLAEKAGRPHSADETRDKLREAFKKGEV